MSAAEKAVLEKIAESPIQVGMDDGNYNTKIVGPNGMRFCIPSRVRHGAMDSLSLSTKKREVAEYEINGTIFSVGAINNSESTMSDHYPTSELNRVVCHHALRAAGLAGRHLEVATGLPLRLFYTGGGLSGTTSPNESLIHDKVQNLTGQIEMTTPAPGYQNNKKDILIAKHRVVGEGLVAFYDFIYDDRGTGNEIKVNKEYTKMAVAFIDMGGRTTDISVVSDANIDMARSGSINAGMLSVRDQLRKDLSKHYSMPAEGDIMLDDALRTGKVQIFGELQDVSAMVSRAKRTVLEMIRDDVQRKVGSGIELAKVVFFGGAYLDFRDQLETNPWFPHQCAADDPLFVNASGMYKYMRFGPGKK